MVVLATVTAINYHVILNISRILLLAHISNVYKLIAGNILI